MNKTLTIFALVAVAGFANASFVMSGAGPFVSDGPIGTATNGHLTGTNTGGSSIIGSITFSGDLTSGGVGSFLTEARWNIKDVTTGVTASMQPFASGTTWSGTQSVTKTIGLVAWYNGGDSMDLESYESFNDSGTDATWNNVSFTFNDATVLNYGSYLTTDSITIDTIGSSFDTELALYSSNGTLIASNDDAVGLQSVISAGTLAQGSYYVLSGGFNSAFNNFSASAGTAAGNMLVQINGANKFTGAHAASTFEIGRFEVVPEPASMVALGLGALGLIRRRRSN